MPALDLKLLPDKPQTTPRLKPQKFNLNLDLLPNKPSKVSFAQTATKVLDLTTMGLTYPITHLEKAPQMLTGLEVGMKVAPPTFAPFLIRNVVSAAGEKIQAGAPKEEVWNNVISQLKEYGKDIISKAKFVGGVKPTIDERKVSTYGTLYGNYWKSITGTEAPEWYKSLADTLTFVGLSPTSKEFRNIMKTAIGKPAKAIGRGIVKTAQLPKEIFDTVKADYTDFLAEKVGKAEVITRWNKLGLDGNQLWKEWIKAFPIREATGVSIKPEYATQRLFPGVQRPGIITPAETISTQIPEIIPKPVVPTPVVPKPTLPTVPAEIVPKIAIPAPIIPAPAEKVPVVAKTPIVERKVYYTGGKEEIKQFAPLGKLKTGEQRLGSFFTSSKEYAQTFAGKEGKITEVYLDIKKPYKVTKENEILIEAPYSHTEFINKLKEQGYDALVLKGQERTFGKGKHDQVFAFYPEKQVKIKLPTPVVVAKPEVTAPKVIPTPKGKAVILPHKEQLLTQIQEAIKKAPDVELPSTPISPPAEKIGYTEEGYKRAFEEYKQNIVTYNEEVKKLGISKVSFQIDGGAEIYNTKKSLQSFYDVIKKQPAIEVEREKGISMPRPTAAKQEDIGKLIKTPKGYWTDGRLLVKGEPPTKTKFDETRPGIKDIKELESLLEISTIPAKKLYYYIRAPDVEGVSPVPVSVKTAEIEPKVVFESEGKYFVYAQNKFNVLNNRFPNATYGVSKNGMLIAYEGKEPKAALMSMQAEGILKEEAMRAGLLPKVEKPTKPKVPSYPPGVAGFAEYMEAFVPKEHTSKVEMPELVKLAQELLGNIPVVTRLKRNLGLFIGKLPPKIKLRPEIFKNPFLAGQVLAHEIGHLVDWLPTHTLARGGLLNRLLVVQNFIKEEFGSLKELAEARKERIAEIGATSKEIKDELIKATNYWHPFDPILNPAYTKTRYQAKELYADALSMLLIQPEKLEEFAPKFYNTFWRFIDRKPEVKQALLELQDFLALGEGEKLRIRSQDIRNMFKKGEELFYEKRTQYQAQQKSLWFRLRTELIDKNTAILNKLKEAEKQGKKINPEDNPKYYLEDWNYIGGKVKNLLDKINTDVVTPLTTQGITQDDLGEYLFLQRVVTERADIANPLGHNRETAQKQLNYLLEKLGQDKFDLLKVSVDKFQTILKNLLDEGNKIGFFKPETFAEIITNPAYATFQVLDYLDDYVTPAIIHQIGTLKGIANPFASTTLKMISTLRVIERVKTNNSVIKFMQNNFPPEIQSAKIRRFGKYKAEVVEKEGYGIIKTREEGKLRGYYVDPYIADSVNYQPRARTNAVLSIFKFLNRSYFRPVYINFNIGFQTFNLMRDFVRAWKLNPNVTFPQMLKKYTEAIPIAKRRIWGNFTDPVITEMQQSGMLSFTYNNLMKGIGDEETEIEFLMKQYDILKKNPQNPAMKVLNAIEEMGDFIETLPKVTGYLSRVKSGRNIKEIAHEVRVFSGSPDFLRKGAGYDWYNNIFLFSNAFKEGFRGDCEGAFSNPRTRSGYWWRTAKLNLLPKILMFLGVLGLFGKRIKDNYDKQTEFDKTNYTTIPLGETEQGKAIYLRIPNDEVGRLLSGILWKVMNFKKSDILSSIQQITTLTAGQLPSFAPEIELAMAVSQYAVGQNPYDFFRGRTVLTNDEIKAGGWYSLKPMARWIAGKLGVYGLTVRAKRDDQTPFEKFIQWTPIIQRYIRITAYGEEEKLREEKFEREQFKARRRLERKR